MTVSDIGADLDHDTAGTPQPTPTPGSNAAIAQGCACPVMDNHHGLGYGGLGIGFVVTEGCPLHDLRVVAERLDRNT